MTLPASYDSWRLASPDDYTTEREEVTVEYRLRVMHSDGTETVIPGKCYPYIDQYEQITDDTSDWDVVEWLMGQGEAIVLEDEDNVKVELFDRVY